MRFRRDSAIEINGVPVDAIWVLPSGLALSDLFLDVSSVIVGWVLLVIRCLLNANL